MKKPAQSFFKLSETIPCSVCKQNIVLYDSAKSEYIACPSCYSYLHIVNRVECRLNKKLNQPEKVVVLKLGSTANIHGTDFQVIAYLEKKESNTIYAWREYILNSLEKGYVTLSEFNGHWNFIAGKEFLTDYKQPTNCGQNVNYKDIEYELFNKYSPIVTAMLGEVDWDVVNERVKATEYVAPPFMIVKEVMNKPKYHTDYYIGEYLSSDEIATAFNLNKSSLPEQIGIGANQPSQAYDRWISSLKATCIATIVVLLLHVLFGVVKPEKELINDNFLITYDAKAGADAFKPFITPSFVMEDESSNIEFDIASGVDNNWLETTIVLVNEANNQTWEVSKGIEYYHGIEDGESWQEGSTEESILLSDIPKGKYHLNVYPSSGDTYRNNLFIRATANVSMLRNTLITIMILCLFPAICWYLMRNYEKRRWDNSDFSPFVKAD
ncbi:DUF4178 domain-containing protein [Pedobacter sp. BG31]|uniref:DUF4178 domain-containing protein n=1 Tax=Pedobacter sp. BG31 TaxID=3349697 RepID=UPI0035F3DAF5